jgi:arginyl-tRNA synthetase
VPLDVYESLRSAIATAAERAGGPGTAVVLTPPAQPEHGDLASPVAMGLAKRVGRAPREIAEAIAADLTADSGVGSEVAGVEVAGPGFINLRLAPGWYAAAARKILAQGDEFGAGGATAPERILMEYVSANPTGPLHVGHARHAAYADSLARILAFNGHAVDREYYINDYGRQMEMLGVSIAAAYGAPLGVAVEVPEDGYRGDYVRAIAETLRHEVGDRFAGDLAPLSEEALTFFSQRGGELMIDAIRRELVGVGVEFDAFFSEASLHHDGRVAQEVAALGERGDTYERDGALWFASSKYGDEKDRVLRRADGDLTYLASDVAYHLEKAGRGHDRLIDVLGADHHGYIARLRAILASAGLAPDMLEVSLIQLVSLVEEGEAKKMSKRAGTLVAMGDLVADIGVDATRFFLVQRSHETPLELDLDLAREQSQENPVYYVQYAHTRAFNILRQLESEPPADAPPPAELDPSEKALLASLARWPEVVSEAGEKRGPHRVVAYLIDLARDFHAFYHRCRVAGEPEDVESFRVNLTRATAATIRTGLGLLGVSAPEQM